MGLQIGYAIAEIMRISVEETCESIKSTSSCSYIMVENVSSYIVVAHKLKCVF